jgi:hypothetical protein
MGTLPTADTLLSLPPVTTPASVNQYASQLAARQMPHVVKGYDTVEKSVSLLDNLLSRQEQPMLRTNGSAFAREIY